MMSSPEVITVPEGMSCVNAFHALWENSKPANYFRFHPETKELQAQLVSSPEKVADIFRGNNIFFDYVGGRMIKTDFSNFPKLNVRLYDRDFEIGAAQKAIEQYNTIPSSERFDKGDSYKFEDLTKH